MGFYSNVIFPRILDRVMDNEPTREIRTAVVGQASGDVLELGFGTGLNLPFYPESVKKITTVDPNPGVNKRAQKRIQESGVQVEHHTLSAETLPLDDASMDTVVCTWTLCSIPDPEQALAEVRRVLRPGGKFLFVEHGLSPEPKVSKWQNRLNPIWKKIGDGCNLNRNHRELIQDAHFTLAEFDNYYLEDEPKFLGYLYQGVATKA